MKHKPHFKLVQCFRKYNPSVQTKGMNVITLTMDIQPKILVEYPYFTLLLKLMR